MEVTELSEKLFQVKLFGSTFTRLLEEFGHVPLPPYINRNDEAEDIERYQTTFAKNLGAVAAPTAGLHFTEMIS